MSLTIPRFYLRLMILPMVLFTAVLLLFRMPAYDDRGLLHLLTPQECPASCFLGIQPKETSIKEALERLQASKWVSKIDNRITDNLYGYIDWEWTSEKPSWIRGNTRGEIAAYEGRVETIVLYTNFQLGETQLALGEPSMEGFNLVARQNRKFTLYFRFYEPKGFVIMSWQPCRVVDPFRETVNIMMMKVGASGTNNNTATFKDLFGDCEI